MIECINCKRNVPEELMSPSFIDGKYWNLCAICALDIINRQSGLPADTPFRGEQARKFYELTVEYYKITNRRIKMDKSYVTLAVCPICREDTGELLLDKRLRPKFEMHTITPNPCENCKKKYLKTGTCLLSTDSGDVMVIKDTAFKRLFSKPIPKSKLVFTTHDVIERINNLQK